MAANMNVLTVASMVIILAAGVGIGWGFQTTVFPTSGSVTTVTTTTGTSPSTSGPYMLTLVETMQNLWNSSGVLQPQFFVLGSHGLESAANISLPVNRLIQLTIVSYDTPDPMSTNAEGVVSGTVGGTVYVINGTLASGMLNTTAAVAANWGKNMTAVPASLLAHTFTIQQLGINVPVIGGATVIAYLNIHQSGTFTWVCMTPCGLGNDGLTGAMNTRGWMTGNLKVS